MSEEKKANGRPGEVQEDAKPHKGLSSSSGGRSLRQSLDLMKRRKGERSPKKKHMRRKSAAKRTDDMVPASTDAAVKSLADVKEKETPLAQANASKKTLARTTSFNRVAKQELEADSVSRAQSLEPSKVSKKLGRTKSFNQGNPPSLSLTPLHAPSPIPALKLFTMCFCFTTSIASLLLSVSGWLSTP